MKKLIFTLFGIIFIGSLLSNVSAQTNVSGGIYSNTTWTLNNSPYIVTDTVVVFPGVTLTIQPGVVVKFDSLKYMEIRQGRIIANGTITDSITFTSNSMNPYSGIWNEIYLNADSMTCEFDYCNFKYAHTALSFYHCDTTFISHSRFLNNMKGLIDGSVSPTAFCFINNCDFISNTLIGINFEGTKVIIDSCNFTLNSEGASIVNAINSSIKHSIINSNQIGLYLSLISIDSCTIKYNLNGIYGYQNNILNCIIDSNIFIGISDADDSIINCEIKYNGEGISNREFPSQILCNDIEYNRVGIHDTLWNTGWGATINGNIIKNNVIGIDSVIQYDIISQNIIEDNSVGIVLYINDNHISCNKICNNNLYDLKYFYNTNISIPNNYWCNTDSATIHSRIFDGYSNIAYGLVSVFAIDSMNCYITSCNQFITSSLEFKNASDLNQISIYPNPNDGKFVLSYYLIKEMQNIASLRIMDVMGRIVYTTTIAGIEGTQSIDVSDLNNGIYFYQLINNSEIKEGKFVISK